MSVVHSNRPATHAETAAEMDRRGIVIERLEAQNDDIVMAMKKVASLIKTQAQYRADHGSSSDPLPWIAEAYRVIDAALAAAWSQARELKMTEPTVEEIVAKADQCGNLHGRELRRLIASWRERGEALEECASDLEAEARRVRAALAAAEHTQGGGE